jgi:hypothetical protein
MGRYRPIVSKGFVRFSVSGFSDYGVRCDICRTFGEHRFVTEYPYSRMGNGGLYRAFSHDFI